MFCAYLPYLLKKILSICIYSCYSNLASVVDYLEHEIKKISYGDFVLGIKIYPNQPKIYKTVTATSTFYCNYHL